MDTSPSVVRVTAREAISSEAPTRREVSKTSQRKIGGFWVGFLGGSAEREGVEERKKGEEEKEEEEEEEGGGEGE